MGFLPAIQQVVDSEGVKETIEIWVKPETGYEDTSLVRAAVQQKYVDSVLDDNPNPGPFWTNQTVKVSFFILNRNLCTIAGQAVCILANISYQLSRSFIQ